MIKKYLSLLFLLVTISLYGQTEGTTTTTENLLAQKGLRCVSKTTIPQEQIDLILNYNFEEYRLADKSVFIKVKDGPHLEVFSVARVATGNPDQVQKIEPDHSDEGAHVHTPASEKKIKMFTIIEVDVFNVSLNNKEN